jgi:hypothetical protein
MTLGQPTTLADGSATTIPVRFSAPALTATSSIEIEEWSGGVESLTAYFEDLARAWRGWVGSKDWDDDGPSISLQATHDGIGLISLSVSAITYAGVREPGSWELRMTIPVEPGSLPEFAARLRALLG